MANFFNQIGKICYEKYIFDLMAKKLCYLINQKLLISFNDITYLSYKERNAYILFFNKLKKIVYRIFFFALRGQNM